MPKYRPKGCKCSGKRRYISSGISRNSDCIDVCTNPICGTGDNLTLLAPVVYDEIGINLCREVPITETLPTSGYPLNASVQILNIDFPEENGVSTTVDRIPGRPNCSLITLTNLSITFAVTIYDCSKQVTDTFTETAVYLPSGPESPDYEYFDSETNPSDVELEIFTPYGLTWQGGSTGTPTINYIGFTTSNSMLTQGLNMIAIPKILNFDTAAPSLTIGISIYVKSIYFSQYLVPHRGRAVVPKGNIVPDEDTICMDFVSGELLDYEIKPLELCAPKFEERLKNSCGECETCCPCSAAAEQPEAETQNQTSEPETETGDGSEAD